MSWNFNAKDHDPSVGFQRQAEGDYTLIVKRTNVFLNREKTGPEGIKLECEIMESMTADGQNTMVGKPYEIELSIMSSNGDRQRISNNDLSAISLVMGVSSFEGQFDQMGNPVKDMFAPALHDKPFKITCVHTTSERIQDDGTTKSVIYANNRNIRNMAGLDANGGKAPTWADAHATGSAPVSSGNPQSGMSQAGDVPAQQPASTAGQWGSPSAQASVPAPSQQPAQQSSGGAPGWGSTQGGGAQGGAPGWGGS